MEAGRVGGFYTYTYRISGGGWGQDGRLFFFGLAESQVSATGPVESCSGFSRRHELSGATGRGEGAALVAAVHPTQPCETTQAFLT